MVRVVLAAQVVDVGRRDQRAAELAAIRTMPSFALSCSASAVRLDLEVDVLGAEDPDQVVDVRRGRRAGRS